MVTWRRNFTFALTLTFAVTLFDHAWATPQLQMVTPLHKSEVSEGHLFHAGVLWVGKSHSQSKYQFSVELYSADGSKRKTSRILPHSVQGIYPASDNSVVVIGKKYDNSWKTYQSHIREVRPGDWRVSTHQFPERYQMYEAASAGGRLYLNEPGARAIYAGFVGSTRIAQLQQIEVSMPGKMAGTETELWVIENRDLGWGDENLVKIDLKTFKAERTFTDFYRNGIMAILPLKNSGLLAAVETGSDQVLLIDREKNRLVETLAVESEPRGVAQYGHCLVVTAATSRELVFIDYRNSPAKIIDRWDLSGAGQALASPRQVAVNEENGMIFVRSTYMCPSCSETQSSVFAVTHSNRTLADCRS